MTLGPLAALDAIEEATGEREVNVIGYCLGGTLLAADASLHGGHGDDRDQLGAPSSPRMVDFAEAGELGVFVDEEQLADDREADGARTAISTAATWRQRST